MDKNPAYTVEMVVTVDIESPDDRQLDEATVVSCARSAVSTSYERHVGQNPKIRNLIPWAKCRAKVHEIDCDIIKGQEHLKGD